MQRVADFIAQHLADNGIERIFMITGGGAMHLNDAIGRQKGLETVFNHHEQACAIAAEGHSRMTGKLSVVNVTTGPGGLNTLTGVMGQWTDSIPVLYISGQVKFETTIHSQPELPLRQMGDQEVDIISVVKPLTKFAVSVTNPADIAYCLGKAMHLAVSGRPGPVWIDVPMNVQGALIEPSALRRYDPAENKPVFDKAAIALKAQEVASRLLAAKRPVLVGGNGIRVCGACAKYIQLLETLKIPAVTTFNAVDMVPSGHPLFGGRIGTVGTRGGNFTLQNADFALFIGTRNNIRQISYGWKSFARHAFTVAVDVDAAELSKHTFRPDMPILADADFFLTALLDALSGKAVPDRSEWVSWCSARVKKYSPVLPQYGQSDKINPYCFVDSLTRLAPADNTIVAGNGTACVVSFQAGQYKEGQRAFWNSGCASMGYDVPAAIGACYGSGRKPVLCLAGDGSIMMNLQELETIGYNKLPIKVFVLDNGGYVSIRQTQAGFFGMPYIGCGPESGVGFPAFDKLGEAFGMKTAVLSSRKDMDEVLKRVLDEKGPVLCHVVLDREYSFSPKLSSERKPDGRMVSKPLEDMYPFLDRDEFADNMLVPHWPEG